MGRPSPASGRTYREVAQQEYGLLMCNGAGCKKGWPESAHRVKGRVDNAGVIHLSRADQTVHRRGLMSFLRLVGWALHDREWAKMPRWQRIYTRETWVWKEAFYRFKTNIPTGANAKERELVHRLGAKAGAKLRTDHQMVYVWTRRVVWKKPRV